MRIKVGPSSIESHVKNIIDGDEELKVLFLPSEKNAAETKKQIQMLVLLFPLGIILLLALSIEKYGLEYSFSLKSEIILGLSALAALISIIFHIYSKHFRAMQTVGALTNKDILILEYKKPVSELDGKELISQEFYSITKRAFEEIRTIECKSKENNSGSIEITLPENHSFFTNSL